MQIFLRELGWFLIIFIAIHPKAEQYVTIFGLIIRLNGFRATDYSQLVEKKQSNPSYCALSPHIISP